MLLSKIVELIKKGNSGFVSSEMIEGINIKSAASLENASKNDITFLASIFAGGISTFGLTTSNGKNGNSKGPVKCSECQKAIK